MAAEDGAKRMLGFKDAFFLVVDLAVKVDLVDLCKGLKDAHCKGIVADVRELFTESYLKGSFFFLDEGFGTLDENLIEVVLDSLEKLRNKNFSIGLISHLAEMKSRIDSKIIVIPASETKGSSIIIQRG